MTKPKLRVFSGIQPTGDLHIGNYIGALKVWAKNQDLYDNIFCVVDLHAITIPEAIKPVDFKKQIKQTVALYLACGLDPKKSAIFVQSTVPAHTELAWILNCITPVSWLEKMTQYKSKAKNRQSVGAGLLNYPVLMAADILLYQTDLVPVGDDQKQHVEIARDIAKRFNSIFGQTFRLPRSLIRQEGARIMGLDDPTQKMSKSIASQKADHAIFLSDRPEIIRRKIARAVTDNKNELLFKKASLGIKNLLTLYQIFSGKSQSVIEKLLTDKGYGFLKNEVSEAIIAELSPIQEQYQKIVKDEKLLQEILNRGTKKVEKIALKTLSDVKKKIGLS